MRSDSHRLALAGRYAPMALPLAFAALPVYVHWPAFAAEHLGLGLSAIGLLLLVARVGDALLDPWLGRWIDGHASSRSRSLALIGAASVVMGLGFAGLFVGLPLVSKEGASINAWSWALVVTTLAVTYLGYSTACIAHAAWGARLGGDAAFRARVTGAREGMALLGVVAASVLPSLLPWSAVVALVAVLLALAWMLLSLAPSLATEDVRSLTDRDRTDDTSLRAPFAHAEFRRLSWVFVLNALASALPATLFLFFVRDRLQAPALEALFLLIYFVAAAASVPVWFAIVKRVGLVRAWMLGLVLSMGAFSTVIGWPLSTTSYALVCAGTGVGLGADLVVPGALLTGVLQRAGAGARAEGVWYGWWGLYSKLALALAAGVSLPLLQWAGYAPGVRDAQSLTALTIAYAVVPLVFKAVVCVGVATARWAEPHPRKERLV